MNIRRTFISTLVAVISLATISLSVSVAWFASSSRAYVDTIDIEMKATRDLRISTTKDIDDIESYTKNELKDNELKHTRIFSPVSSMYESKWFDETAPIADRAEEPKFYEYQTALSFEEEPRLEEVSNKVYDEDHNLRDYLNNYYSQDLYLIADDDVYVSINPETTSISPNEDENRNTAHELFESNDVGFRGYTEDEIFECLNKLANAMRISILVNNGDDYNYYIYNPNRTEDTKDTLLGGRLDIDKDSYYDTFTKNSNRYETIYGEVLNERFSDSYYGEVGTGTILPPNSKFSAFTASSHEYAHPFDYDKAVEEGGLSIKTEKAYDKTNAFDLDDGIVIPVYRNVPSKFVLSIYLEGWDLDCINTTMGAKFLAQIEFKILREM